MTDGGHVHVVQHAGRDAAGPLLRVEANAQSLQVLEQLSAQIGDDPVAEVDVEVSAAVKHGGVQEGRGPRQLGEVKQPGSRALRAGAAGRPGRRRNRRRSR